MRIFRFFFITLLTICLLIALNIRISGLPAFGKLLNPFSGFYHLGEAKDAVPLDYEVESSNLINNGSVYFDERRIPHIFAENEEDLYYLQGYVVASLRLWQMEFQVLAAEGRIAELLGDDEKYINFDKEQRRIGLKYGAENKLATLENDPVSKKLIDQFTKGVNDYIDQLSPKDLPIEYQLMGYQPEPWSPYKTTLLLMNMSNVLTSTEYDIEYSNFIQQFGQELYDSLYGQYYDEIEPILIPPGDSWDAYIESHQTLEETPLPLEVIDNSVSMDALADKPDVQIGSNNWAVSGKKTASGYPMLANDPHLRLTFPSVWVEMHLHSPEVNVYGVVFPGAPGIVIGFNDHIGWGVTNAGRDVKDWYEIEFKDDLKDFYKWQDGWKATTKVIEEIKVKNAPSVYDTIIFTHLGPVAYEKFATNHGTKNFAIQWMAHRGSQEYLTFYKLNRAKDFEDYLDALRHYECPAQNFVFACVDGDIALRQQGKFPILEQNEGLTYQDGSKEEAWNEFIPFEHIPMMYNPDREFVSSANQHVADTSYPYYYNGVFEYYRNRVINQELRLMHDVTVEDFKALHFNNYNLMADEYLAAFTPYMNQYTHQNNSDEIYQQLTNWDYINNKESEAAIYFQLWLDAYYTLLWDEFVERDVPGGWDPFQWKKGWKAPNEYQTYQLLIDSVQHQFIDFAGTAEQETQKDIIYMAFEDMLGQIEQLDIKEWGKYKNTSIEHVAKIEGFSTHVDVGGNYKIVNATGKYHGPSWRMILDFAEGKITGYGVYPGGQSGNPGSYYYDNMVSEWANGEYHLLINESDPNYYENENFIKVNFKKQ